jgi:hypothetical protein
MSKICSGHAKGADVLSVMESPSHGISRVV